MKTSEIVRKVSDIVEYLSTYNKNLTKEQYYKILELVDFIHELKKIAE